MVKAIALVHAQAAPLPGTEILRALIVACCGLALALAGPVLPI